MKHWLPQGGVSTLYQVGQHEPHFQILHFLLF